MLTATPSGVGWRDPPHLLCSGDVVRIKIARFGAIEHTIA